MQGTQLQIPFTGMDVSSSVHLVLCFISVSTTYLIPFPKLPSEYQLHSLSMQNPGKEITVFSSPRQCQVNQKEAIQ
jgi:hypothetical protein